MRTRHGAVAVVDDVVHRLGAGGGAGALDVAEDEAGAGGVHHPGGEVDHDRLVVGGRRDEGDLAGDQVLVVDLARAELGGGVHHARVGVDGRAQGGVVGRAGLDAADLHHLGGGRLPAEDALDEAGHAGPGGPRRSDHDERAVGLVTPDDRLPGVQRGGGAAGAGEAPGQLAEGHVHRGVCRLLPEQLGERRRADAHHHATLGHGGPDVLAAVEHATHGPAEAVDVGAAVGAGQVAAGQVRAGQVVARQVGAGQVAAGQVAAGQVRASQVVAGQVGAGQVGAGQVAAGQVRAGQVVARQVGAGQVVARQVGAGQVRAAQVGAGQVGAGQVVPARLLPARLAPARLAPARFSPESACEVCETGSVAGAEPISAGVLHPAPPPTATVRSTRARLVRFLTEARGTVTMPAIASRIVPIKSKIAY